MGFIKRICVAAVTVAIAASMTTPIYAEKAPAQMEVNEKQKGKYHGNI